MPSVEKIAVYRSYIAACKVMNEKVHVSEETSKVMEVVTFNALHNFLCGCSIFKMTLSVGVNKTNL